MEHPAEATFYVTEHAANTRHVLTVRAEITQRVEENSHVERSCTAIDPELAKASAS